MMMLEHLDKLAETSAQAISNIKFDKVVVWEGGQGNGSTNTADFLKGMARSLPPMMQVMKDIGGVEFADSLIKFHEDESVAGSDGRPVNRIAAELAKVAGSGEASSAEPSGAEEDSPSSR